MITSATPRTISGDPDAIPKHLVRVLAIDPGTRCGWALGVNGMCISSGTWDLAPMRQRRFEGGGMRYVRLRQYLDAIGKVDRVVVEEVRRHMGVDAAHVYGGVLATVTSWCESMSIPYSAEPVGSIKKFATGKGNADKPQMVEAVRDRWAIDVVDDNQADAVALLFMVMES